MIDPNDIRAKDAELRALLEVKFGISAVALDRGLRRAGRRIPKHLHEQAAVLTDAVAKSGHPKLMRMLDAAAIEKAHGALVDYLQQVDPKERRKDAVLGTLGVIVFNLIVVFVLLVAVLVWRGLV